MKPLLDLEPTDCRWPVTDTKPFLFCGEPKAGHGSYCACHKAMSVSSEQPVSRPEVVADYLAGGKLVSRQKSSASTQRMPVDTAIALNRCAGNTAWGIE